jgi:hypothetical protein
MFALVQQIFLGEKHLVKNWLFSTLDKVLLQRSNFSGVYGTSLHFTK